MNKEGQFLIIFAVILGIIILSVSTIFNTVIKTGRESVTKKNFELMCENYRYEISKISERAILSGNKGQEKERIKEFTQEFMRAAKSLDNDFGLFYIYGDNSEAIVVNYLDFSIKGNNQEVLKNGGIRNFNGAVEIIIINETEKINKEYELSDNEKFWFLAMTKKEGERYVCE